MTVFAVDSSVGLKWLVPEIHSADALRLLAPADELHVPTFFDVEIGNILWKKLNRKELTRTETDAVLGLLPGLPVTRHPVEPLVADAFDIAALTQRTVYDCLYLALAIRLDCQMVTADRKLNNALAATPWNAHICWIEEI